MLLEDRRGAIALHEFPDGAYVVTDAGARLLRDTCDLDRQLAAAAAEGRTVVVECRRVAGGSFNADPWEVD